MSGKLLRAAGLLIVLALILPVYHPALAAPPLPPVDMFQLPWELGKAWVALDGFDNGLRRHPGSPHNHLNSGAVDFAPHNNMRKGEDTSGFWVTAAAAGTVVETSVCHLKIAHANAWITEYYHLANFQVKLGDAVVRNQKLAVIANASTQPVCLGSVEKDIPHLHFALRPNMVGATFAGWEFKYNSIFNITTFVKGASSLGLFQPLLNEFSAAPGSTSTPPGVPTGITDTPTSALTPPTGPFVSTTVDPAGIQTGAIALVTVRLNNVPPAGYTSAEFTCSYNAALLEAGNISVAGLFGPDAASAVSGPQSGNFILAIAGSKGNKATTSGIVFTFSVRGLLEGLSSIECDARVSPGDNTLTDLPSVGTSLTVFGIPPTASTSPSQPFTATPTAFVAASATPTASLPGPGDRVRSLAFLPVAMGLSQPVFVTNAGDGSNRLFVLERVGRIRVIDASGNLLPTPFLDISSIVRSAGSEEGILGLAFHPNYESNGLFYVTYTNTSGDLTLARYSVSADPNMANSAGAVSVLTVPHPTNGNHNGGMIAFGNDGYLYWSTGDGGGAGDGANNAQNTNILLGKILRLDINSGSPYGIPPDNPFVGAAGARAEIWDYGLRNPWRFSFDRGTGDLYIGDVGQGSREEIDYEPSSSSGGLNYGWRVMEGSLCFNPSSGCDTSGKVLPVVEYANTAATCAVTGGYVYRGLASTQMTGIYFYGDYCSGEIWGLLQFPSGVWESDLITDTGFFISSFSEDEAGELYLTDYASGSVQRIVGPSSSPPSPTPTFTPMAVESATPTATSSPLETATPTPFSAPTHTFTPLPSPTLATPQDGTLTGQVFASKPVTVGLYDAGNNLIASVSANPDGTFNLTAIAGNYTVIAVSSGSLSAQGSAPLAGGSTTTKPVVTLPGGDVDGNNVIDQFDAMTIGINYGSTVPSAADLNNDGTINVLDLEILADNYRATGPLIWE